MAVSKRTRFEVLKRDDHTCQYCGAKAPDAVLHVDHVIPKSLGGSNKPENLLTACKDCNAGKGSSNLTDEKVSELSDRAAHYAITMRRAATAIREDYEAFESFYQEFEFNWKQWSITSTGEDIPIAADHRPRLFQWWKAGLPEETVVDAINITMARPNLAPESCWRYFCGVIWNMFDDYELSLNVRGVEGPNVYTEQEREDYGEWSWRVGFDSGYKRAFKEMGIGLEDQVDS